MLFLDWRPTATAAIELRTTSFVLSGDTFLDACEVAGQRTMASSLLSIHPNIAVTVAVRTDGLFLFHISCLDEIEFDTPEARRIAAELSHCLKYLLGHRHIFHSPPLLDETSSRWSGWTARMKRDFILRQKPVAVSTKKFSHCVQEPGSSVEHDFLLRRALQSNDILSNLDASNRDTDDATIKFGSGLAILKIRENYSKIFDRLFQLKAVQKDAGLFYLAIAALFVTTPLAIYFSMLIHFTFELAPVSGSAWHLFGAMVNPTIAVALIFAAIMSFHSRSLKAARWVGAHVANFFARRKLISDRDINIKYLSGTLRRRLERCRDRWSAGS